MYRLYFKRLLDLLLAVCAAVVLLPVFLVVTVLLLFANSGKPFFTQLRPGLNEKIFRILKFKTMNDRLDESGNLLPDAQRLTRVGKFIRKTSIDELPQLINVIKGEMSLIGPRPLQIRYLPWYSAEESLRHQLRPGITGWAQVNGRNVSNWNDRLAADVYYYKNLSLALDTKIFFLTIQSVFSGRDVVVDPDSIMDSFDVERENLKTAELSRLN